MNTVLLDRYREAHSGVGIGCHNLTSVTFLNPIAQCPAGLV